MDNDKRTGIRKRLLWAYRRPLGEWSVLPLVNVAKRSDIGHYRK
jgi:hypothetical protein